MFRWLGNILSDVMDDDQRIPPPHDLAYINTYESQIYYCCDGAKGTIASNTLVTPLNIVPRCRALRSCPLVLIADTSGCGADLDMARSNNPEAGELRWYKQKQKFEVTWYLMCLIYVYSSIRCPAVSLFWHLLPRSSTDEYPLGRITRRNKTSFRMLRR